MVETARLDPDEESALDAIVAFIRDCEGDLEVIEALIMAQVGAEARAYAQNKPDDGRDAPRSRTRAPSDRGSRSRDDVGRSAKRPGPRCGEFPLPETVRRAILTPKLRNLANVGQQGRCA